MLRAKAALKGYAPSYGMTRTVPDGFSVKGVSSYYDKEGALKGQWVKSKADEARQAEIMREIIAGYCNELPAFPVVKRPEACDGPCIMFTRLQMRTWACWRGGARAGRIGI